MKNKIVFIAIITLVFMILLIPLKGSYAFYSDNKDLEIINTKVGDWNTLIGYLRINDKNNDLSSTIQGDMYRYQGTDGVNNWICFGTTENCGATDELVDKYMYRIIGITSEGQLKLLKETFLKEENITGFRWNLKYRISDCLGDTCEWPNADLYKRLNGISNGIDDNTDIFVDSTYYDYLKSGDSYNGANDDLGSSWYQLIEEHDWMYGDIDFSSIGYNGNEMYGVETGKTSTKRNWPDDEQTTCSNDNPCTAKNYTWSKSINAKIGLMYIHDVDYAYIGGIPGNMDNVVNSWIHFQKDGYNSSLTCEWLITRFGVNIPSETNVAARNVYYDGGMLFGYLVTSYGVRPVFYLNSDVNIKSGTTGTKANPFILDVTD